MSKRQSGFTLIEIAIVLVIIGLLLGGVLKGQELITGARVRNVISQQDGVKAAYFGFLDRYRALPGDYGQARANIPNILATNPCVAPDPSTNGAGNGDGNGQITGIESTLAWEHLSKAGFINGTYNCAATVSQATSPTNPYGQFLVIAYDNAYGGGGNSRHNLKTGGQIPSDLLGEIDRKVDDGNALQGSFRAQTGVGVTATTTECYDANGVWAASSAGTNCGGATLF